MCSLPVFVGLDYHDSSVQGKDVKLSSFAIRRRGPGSQARTHRASGVNDGRESNPTRSREGSAGFFRPFSPAHSDFPSPRAPRV